MNHMASDLIATFNGAPQDAMSDQVISVANALGTRAVLRSMDPLHASADTKTSEHVW